MKPHVEPSQITPRKTVILTGASGFVGANLARRILHDGHDLHLLMRPGYAPHRVQEIAPLCQIHEVDFQNRAALDALFQTIAPHWVFHLAAHGAYSWQNDATAILQTNILGTANLVEAFLKTSAEAFVNAGSSSEYGLQNHAPDENENPQPNSHYALAKLAATHYCRLSAQKTGRHIPTLRLYSVYGPFEDSNRLIPALVQNALQKKWPPLVNPDIARDFVFVDDVCEAFIVAAQNPTAEKGAIFNVGSGTQTTLRDLIEVAARVFEIKAAPEWGTMPARGWDSTVWVSNPEKIARYLGWRATTDLATGLRKTAEWFAQNPAFSNAHR